MEDQQKKMAEEIAILREQQGLTFRAIGETLRLPPGKVSYLYHELQRQRRILRYRELREQQNQIAVSLSLTLGEGLVLQKVLSFYQNRMFRENSRYLGCGAQFPDDPDFAVAEELLRRISELDYETRQKTQSRL